MTAPKFHTSRPDHWTLPKPTRDPAQQRALYGALQPMPTKRVGLLARLFGRVG